MEQQGKLPKSFGGLAIPESKLMGRGEPLRSHREEQSNPSCSKVKWQGLLRARGRINVTFWGKQLEISRLFSQPGKLLSFNGFPEESSRSLV